MGITSQTVKGLLARGTRMLRHAAGPSRGGAVDLDGGGQRGDEPASQTSAAPTLVSTTAARGRARPQTQTSLFWTQRSDAQGRRCLHSC